MDAVVLHSDIARLVLGYLKRQNLERTSRLFCKTSPHLKQEFSAYRKGFTPHTFGPYLEDIICEYVNITRTVDRVVSSLPNNQRFQLFECKLSDKVKILLERALDSYVKTGQSLGSNLKNSDVKHSSAASTSVPSDKENTAKKHSKQKRKRACLYSSDEQKGAIAMPNKPAKRRRILEPFCYLSAKQKRQVQRHQRIEHTSSTGDENTHTDDDVHEGSAEESGNQIEGEDADVGDNESDQSIMEKPTKESTPRNKSLKGKFLTPSVPELSQAILDNPHFQMKLVDNINQALGSSTNPDGQATFSDVNSIAVNIPTNTNTLSEEQQIINSNEMLDQLVKDILKATEKDPAFDAIIENVVGASIQPSNVSAGVQCNIDNNTNQSQLGIPTVQTQSVQQQQQQQHFTLVKQQAQQQLAVPYLSALTHETAASTSAPRTPLIIRTAVTAASTSLSGGNGTGGGESQMLTAISANNSFGSLIDPNFSISKLIVLNPNDSAQKQTPSVDQSIGNTTADQLFNQLAGGVAEATGDEQVYFDANTGQLTIPLLLTDEGLLTNFPFLVNNEAVTQQLQPDNICNMDASRIEIPLPEPIIVSADQLPPNSIIVTSAQKAIAVEEQRLPSVEQPPRTDCKIPKDEQAPSFLIVSSNADGETPSTSGIVNMKTYKSLSTPRKRTSHVRTLSFSPKVEGKRVAVQVGTTPLSTRHDTLAPPAEIAEERVVHENSSAVPEKPIIKNVEILPRLDGTIDVSANESSNSCSVPPLFVTEESSNQTVIKTKLSLKENKDTSLSAKPQTVATSESSTANHPDTPKRKQVRRVAVRACKRRLSKSSDEIEKPNNKQIEKQEPMEAPSEAKEQILEQRKAKLSDDKMMEEWLRLRNASASDLDSRLRQLNAEQNASVPKSARRTRNTSAKKRKLRRKKPVLSKRMRKKAAALALLDHERKGSLDDNAKVDETKEGNESEQLSEAEVKTKKKSSKSKTSQEKKRASKDRSMEFNIKIPTPQKDKRESLLKMRNEHEGTDTDDIITQAPSEAVDRTTLQSSTEQTDCNPPVKRAEKRLEHERDRRTANIACLLETPFKAPNTLGEVPPTPGMPVPILDTPASKLGEIPLSTSYLFGSLTKSELETPQLSAITPGFRFTPFGSSRDVTPRSVAPATDYSSGGSYYKPDESDDLDRKFDKLLRDSAQKQNQEEKENSEMLEQQSKSADVKSSLFEDQRKTPELRTEQKEDAICVEIPAEKLRVEPIVLKRVKSFGAEGTENDEGVTPSLNIDPHYTLVSELPEICAEEESSNSSSTFSSSSSSSSNSSSSSSSSSSDSSPASPKEAAAAGDEEQEKTPDNLRLSLDNLSSISSTEDEEWQKLAVTEEENSQLVSNDGEVRYPVRSWLTPNKVDQQPSADAQERSLSTIIKVTVPLKSAEKKNRLEDDLQQKRERMMEKLKRDANLRQEKQTNVPSTPPSGITAALTATRKIAAMREKGRGQPIKSPMPTTTSTAEEKRSLEVLTALQLSAKKSYKSCEAKTRPSAIEPLISALDDNATSTLFSSAAASSSITTTYALTEKTERLPLKTLISKVKAKQRQCVQIEALPALKSKRSGMGRKKIVRNPLGFKGTTAADAVDKAERIIEEVKSPLKLAEKSAEYSDESPEETRAGISPVPKIKIKAATGLTAVRSSKLRVSPRLSGSKNLKTKDCEADNVEEVQTKPVKILKTTKSIKTRATTAKTLLATRIKVEPVRQRSAKSKKAAENMQCETAKLKIEQTQSEDTDVIKEPDVVGVSTIDEGKEKILVKEKVIIDKQDQADKTENEKSQEKKDAGRVEEEKQTSKPTKPSKTFLESTELIKDAASAKANTAGKVEATKVKPSESDKHLLQEKSLTPEKNAKTVAAKKEDMPKPTNRATESANIPKEKSTQSESQQFKKAETAVMSISDVKKNYKENFEAPQTSSSKEMRETAQITEECPPTPTSTTNVEPTTIEISEDDPLEGCEFVTVTDEDPLRFISVIYDGPDVPPMNPLPRRDFTNFKMVVAFDDDEKHIWRVTDELMLFHASPATQQIRNIPKKRKVRINTCSSEQDDIAMVGIVHSTTTTLATASTTSTLTPVSSSGIDKNASSSSREAKPAATSTPISAPATSTSTQEPKKLLSKATTSAADVATTSKEATKTTTKTTAETTEVLQMDDIESVLSHLHGNKN